MKNGAEQSRTGWKPILLSLVVLPLLNGCSKELVEHVSASEPVLSRQYRQGSAVVVMSLSETNIPSSGSIQLMLDVHAPVGSEVVFPEVGISVEPFTISGGYLEPLQTLPNGKQRHRRIWMLVPALPGESVFRPLDIRAGSARITTEPIEISVTSLLPAGLDIFEIKDVAAPIALLPEQAKLQRRWKLMLAAAGTVALLVFIIRRVRKPKHVPVLPPHDIAFQALEQLPEDPLEKIQSLSEILIAYLGGRFALPVGGKTIPEIIPLLPRERLLGRRTSLEKYLIAGEQIRFSNRIPAEFAGKFEQYVRAFVKETTEEAACD